MSTNTCDPACSGKTPICSNENECVQCMMDSQCSGDNSFCSDYKCVECQDDSQCEPMEKVCSNNACVECTYENQMYCGNGFCLNNVCTSECKNVTTGKDISACLKPGACCFNELTGGRQLCALDPSMIDFDGRRCIIKVDTRAKGDRCKSSVECGAPPPRDPERRLRMDPFAPNPAIIEQFGAYCRNTMSGEYVNCIEANDADAGSSIGCAGLDSSEQGECIFCPSGSPQSECNTVIPPNSEDSGDSEEPMLQGMVY